MDDLQRRISIANARRAELLKRTEEARALAAAARGAARAEAELAEAEDELFEPLATAWCEWGLAMLWLLLAPAQFTLSAIFVVVTLSYGGKYEVLFIASVCLLFALPLFRVLRLQLLCVPLLLRRPKRRQAAGAHPVDLQLGVVAFAARHFCGLFAHLGQDWLLRPCAGAVPRGWRGLFHCPA